MYEIRDNVPIPRRKSKLISTAEAIKVGQSFILGYLSDNKVRSVRTMLWKNLPGKKFSVRKTEEGYGCWRVK